MNNAYTQCNPLILSFPHKHLLVRLFNTASCLNLIIFSLYLQYLLSSTIASFGTSQLRDEVRIDLKVTRCVSPIHLSSAIILLPQSFQTQPLGFPIGVKSPDTKISSSLSFHSNTADPRHVSLHRTPFFQVLIIPEYSFPNYSASVYSP